MPNLAELGSKEAVEAETASRNMAEQMENWCIFLAAQGSLARKPLLSCNAQEFRGAGLADFDLDAESWVLDIIFFLFMC